MRRSFLGIAALAFVTACADGPVGPALTELAPTGPNLYTMDNPPPPWAVVHGEASVEYEGVSYGFSYVGWVFINKPGNVAWLMFRDAGTTATFSGGARLMNVNGRVIGTGSVTVGGNTVPFSSVTSFSVDRSCTTDRGASCVSFGGGGFTSIGAVWTGELANNRIRKPGDGGGGGEVCYLVCDGYVKGP